MSADQLLAKVITINARQDATLAMCLASELSKGAPLSFAHLNISLPLQAAFRKVVSDNLGALAKLKADGDLDLRAFAAGFKPDEHEVEYLEVDDIDVVKSVLDGIPGSFTQIPMFDHAAAFIKGLKYYVLMLVAPGEKRVLFFRKYSAHRELSRSRMFAAYLSDGQFDRITQPTLLFDEQIDCFAFEKTVFVVRKHDFQTVFGYFAHIEQKARECLAEINSKIPIENFEAFVESCGSHKQKMMKLVNIGSSPYLKTVKMKDIRKVIKQFKLTGVKIVKSNGVEMLEFDSENRWVILKLLNDDYLGSVMTKVNYEVNSKRQL